MAMICRLCKKNLHEIGGYLQRVNEKGVDPIWECRPSCTAKQTAEQNMLDAIQGDAPVAVNLQDGEVH